MLEIRKGKSTKSYENEFFRKISKELSQVFKQRKWDGLLLGMPECLIREDLQIDCLLITKNQIIIIDFKNYSGTLQLPITNFKQDMWIINGDTTVKGGSSSNPFSQLGKQRTKLFYASKRLIHDLEKYTISTMVCFHHQVEIIGEIPEKLALGFSIVDPSTYLNNIIDIIDIIDNKKINYLTENSKKVFMGTLFNVDPYSPETFIELEVSDASPSFKETTINTDVSQQVQNFLESNSKIMTIVGNVGSGKLSFIPSIRDMSFKLGYTYVPVFAYSNRSRRKMLSNHSYLEEVESLYSFLFDFNNETMDDYFRKTIPLRENDPIDDQEKAIYIIYDSQLISNTDFDTDILRFGSGYLLDDILSKINLEANPESKIIFIGDRNKLSYGSSDESALNSRYLKILLERQNLYSEIMEIELPDANKDSEIIKVCNKIAKNIRNNQYNNLMINSTKEINILEENKKALSEVANNPNNNKILVYTNEQALKVNDWIKRKLIKNGSEIAPKDHIVFNSTMNAYRQDYKENSIFPSNDLSQTHMLREDIRVDNGYFGEVISVDVDRMIVKYADVNQEKIKLTFIPCEIKLQNGVTIKTLLLDNYLKSTKNQLTKKEMIGLQIILTNEEKAIFSKEPFESSMEFKTMLQHPNDFIKIEKDRKIVYRNPLDKRRITHYEKEYRQRILKKLNHYDSEYFKILNAAKVKYAWALTVHKAMVYEFDTVFFNTDQEENRGRNNREYFKWIYTGTTIGRKQVNLINWIPITPFSKTEFKEGTALKRYKDYIFQLSNGEESSTKQIEEFLKLKINNVATIKNIKSRPFLENVTLEINNKSLELDFYYDGKGNVKVPRKKRGEEEDYQTILELLKPPIIEIPTELGVIKPILEELMDLFKNYDIEMKLMESHNWNLFFDFSKENLEVVVQIWYNSEGLISNFLYSEGSNELYEGIVKIIKDIYILV